VVGFFQADGLHDEVAGIVESARPFLPRSGGDERRYLTLADYPYRPQENLALSLDPTTLGATVAVVPRLTSGRVNRAFEHLTPDGTIDCYGPIILSNRSSWFIALTSATNLSIELVTHAFGASPCLADPSTWAFGSARVLMVR